MLNDELWDSQQMRDFAKRLNKDYPYETKKLFTHKVLQALVESFLYSVLAQRDSKWVASGDELFRARWSLMQIMQSKYGWDLGLELEEKT